MKEIKMCREIKKKTLLSVDTKRKSTVKTVLFCLLKLNRFIIIVFMFTVCYNANAKQILQKRSTEFFYLSSEITYAQLELAKMRIPFMCVCNLYHVKFVWRQSEFAFFMRLLRLAHFLF